MHVTNDQKAAIPHAFKADAPYPANTRIKMSGVFGVLTAAGDEDDLGTLARRSKAANDPATVISKTASGAIAYVANGAIPQGSDVFAAADGKVDLSGTRKKGVALNTTAADGDSILVMPS